MTNLERQDPPWGAFSESDLMRRLLRRATDPIGMINVHHSARLHLRSSFARNPSLELLEHFKHRYGLGGARAGTSSSADMSLTVPLQRLATSNQPDLASASSLSGVIGMSEPMAATMQTLPTANSEPQFRVIRPYCHQERSSSRSVLSGPFTSGSRLANETHSNENPTSETQWQRNIDETVSRIVSQPT